MSVLDIIELILSLVPEGITVTQDILNLIKQIQTSFGASPAEITLQKNVVIAYAKTLKK
jgi:hypothetical protein